MPLGTSWTSVLEKSRSHCDGSAGTADTESKVTQSGWQPHKSKSSTLMWVSHIIFKRCEGLTVTLRQASHSAMLLDVRFHIMRKGIQMNLESNSLICLVRRQGGGECASGEAESELTFFLECWQLLPFEKQQGNWRCWERFKGVCVTTTLVRRPGPTKIKQD